MKPTLVFIILLFTVTSNCFGWEFGEFRSGMSREKVKEIISTMGFDHVDENKFLINGYDDPRKSFRDLTLYFKNEKVYQIQKNESPEFNNFIILIKEQEKEHGPPSSIEAKPIGDAGHYTGSALHLIWDINDHFEEIAFIKFEHNTQVMIVFKNK